MRTSTLFALLLTPVFAGAGAALAADAAIAPAAPAAQTSQAPSIIAVRARTGIIVDRVLASGVISAVEEVLVQPQLEGLAVNSLNADVGDRVEAGQVVAKLADDQLILQRSQLNASRAKAQASIAQLEAQMAEATANAGEAVKTAERARTLAANGTFTTVQAEQAEAQATAAKARVRSAEAGINVARTDVALVDAQIEDVALRLARTDVKTPVGGIVTVRGARIGAIASASAGPLFTIIRDGALELRADVAEIDMLRLKEGQKVEVTVAGATEPRKGEIRLIEPVLSTTTRLGMVRIALTEPDGLRAGMFGEAGIIVTERSGILVPVTSVNISPKGSDVLRISDGRAETVPVKTGIRSGGVIEILDGLQDGDMIVAKAGAFVRNGDRVNPVEETPGGSTAAVSE